MFLERLLQLCSENGTDITNVLKAIGLSTSKGTAWRSGAVPNGEILSMLSSYFEVSVDYLLGLSDQKEKLTPVSEGETISPKRKALLDAAKTMDDKTIDVVLGIIESLKQLGN